MMEENKELQTAWEFVENTGRSIFLTGKAGTGKTTFLKAIVEKSKKRSIVVAPTGVAAINAGGVTIHSFFQLPLSPFVPGAKVEPQFDYGKEKRKIMASLDLLIIDEISMVRADLLDAIDNVLRRYRDHFRPFGGVQLLMIGDLAQLTPVVRPEDEELLRPYYNTPYFFGSKALQQMQYVTIQLSHIFRQQDDKFIGILNHIREGKPTADDLSMLNARCQPAFVPSPDEPFIRLTTHNRQADNYNESELRKLSGKSSLYHAEITGNFPEYSYPTAETLELKVGAQVMFIKNDPSSNHLFYNGRIGKVVDIEEDCVRVHCEGDEDAIEVFPMEWENAKYTLNEKTKQIEAQVQGVFKQYPLRLAWAITIHKSQGLTFDRAIIEANRSFAPGQVYVALSRCRSLEGLVLAAPLAAYSIINDATVDAYMASQEAEAERSIEQLPTLKQEYERYLLLQLFDFRSIFYFQESMVRIFKEYFYHSHPQLTSLHDTVLKEIQQKLLSVADKWQMKIQTLSFNELRQQEFLERVKRSAEYFEKTIDELMTRPLALSAEVETENKQAKRRLANTLADIKQAVLANRYLLNKIADNGFTVDYYLKEKHYSMLDALDETEVKKSKRQRTAKPKEKKEPKPKTWTISYDLYRQGKSVKEIAEERGLVESTVRSHLERYVKTGEVPLDVLVSPASQKAILSAIEKIGEEESATAIKELCPAEVTFEEIFIMKRLTREEAENAD